MANIDDGRMPAGALRRWIVFCFFSVVSTTVVLFVLFAAALIVSGVLVW